MLHPKEVGHPIEGFLAFRPSPHHKHLPRLPWPFESETRPAGTGLIWNVRRHKDDDDHHHHQQNIVDTQNGDV
jgi:hypothetical protein